ncbi:MAG: transposase [Leptospiraceae bacterium]|nr:transposase [Leptospiraceae bacterium]
MKKCASCPLKEKCVAYKKKSNPNKIDTKRRWLDERNAKFKSGEYQTLCKLRPPVEGLMETKTKISEGANTRLRKVGHRMILRAIGINFRRYATHIAYFFKNLLFPCENEFQLCDFETLPAL